MSTNNNVEKKSLFKRWWFWLIIVSVVVAVGSGIGGRTTSNDDQKKPENSTVLYYIGDEVDCANWKIQVESVSISNWISNGNETTHFDITFYATNMDNKKDTFDAKYVTVKKDSYSYEHIKTLNHKYFQSSRVCNPLIKEKFVMSFEVPRDSNPEDFVLHVKFIISKIDIILKNK